MTLVYADPRSDKDIDDMFSVMYHDECIDSIPASSRRVSYFLDAVNQWREGAGHVFIARDASGAPVAVLRGELVGESDYLLHLCALRVARTKELYKLAAVAMDAVAERTEGDVTYEALIEKDNKPAIGLARILGMKFQYEEDGDLLYAKGAWA